MPHRSNPEHPDYDPAYTQESRGSDENPDLAKAALRAGRNQPWWENAMWTWVFQGFLAACMALLVGYVTLWMDSHNDTRYVKRVDYDSDNKIFVERYKDNRDQDRKDRESIRVLALQDKADLNKRLDRQEVQLDTIANDIKSLLRQGKP